MNQLYMYFMLFVPIAIASGEDIDVAVAGLDRDEEIFSFCVLLLKVKNP